MMLRHAGMFRGNIRCQMGDAGELLRATLGLQFQLVKLVNLLHRPKKPSLTLTIAVSVVGEDLIRASIKQPRESSSYFCFCLFYRIQHTASCRATNSYAAGAGDCRLNSRWSVAAPGCQALSGNQCLWARLPMVTCMSAREKEAKKICWYVYDLYTFMSLLFSPPKRCQNSKIWGTVVVDFSIYESSAILQVACEGQTV